MSRSRNPFGTVLGALRQRLADGLYAPGQALAIAELAQEFEFSTTPVREALAWLAGERLIEVRRGAGFSCWRVELEQLLCLYDLHEAYLLLALRRLGPRREFAAPSRTPADSPTTEAIRRTAHMFAQVAAASGSAPLFLAHSALAARLGNVRRAEIAVLPDAQAELLGYDQAEWTASALEGLVREHHALRRAAAQKIFRCLMSDEIYSRI